MQRLIFFAVLIVASETLVLPGYNGPSLSQSTGYINVPNTGKSIFYWLVESQNQPKSDPLVIWFQGGPGCSGLLGLFTEIGPFVPNMAGGLDYNALSWTNFANVLFIEQPAGVGFSYGNSSSAYTTNDFQVAQINFQVIQSFLQAFPQYQGRKTWLAGESYAGVYIPTLTSVILENPASMIYSQLAGLSLGNPVISCESADYVQIQFNLLYWHALVSHSVYSNWTEHNCQISARSEFCNDLLNVAFDQIGVIYQQKRGSYSAEEPNLDPDNLYQDFCTGNGTLNFAEELGYPNECQPVGNRLVTYLNRKDVQQAIGAKSTNWQECTSLNYNASGDSMIPFYQKVFDQRPDVKVLVYSGDVDIATVPFGFTKACLAEIGSMLISPWQPWYVNEATAGYVEQFEEYTYATIKGGGHETPQYQPLISYNMFYRFITTGILTGVDEPMYQPRRFNQGRMLKKYGIKG